MNPLDIDLDWELGLFKAVRALWRSVAGEPPPRWNAERSAYLSPLRPRLTTLGSLLAETALSLEIAREEGGVRGTLVLLPEAIDIGPDPEVNTGLFVLRVCMDATIVRLAPRQVGARASLLIAEKARDRLMEELPRFGEAWADVAPLLLQHLLPPDGQAPSPGLIATRALVMGDPLDPALLEQLGDQRPPSVVLWGRLLRVERPDDLQNDGEGETERPPASDTEHEAPGVEDLTIIALKEEEGLDLPIHAFEKIELLEGFNGVLRQLDGEDDLSDHLDALEEIDLGHLVRGGPEAGAVYHAEVGLEVDVPDVSTVRSDEVAVFYPEWNRKTSTYRENWCAVYPTLMPRVRSSGLAMEALLTHKALIGRLYEELMMHRTQRTSMSRQPEGGELDLDAVVAAQADLRAGRQPSDRLYIRRPRQRRDVATTVLLDISLSSDSWIEGRRVLDVAREAIWVLGEVAERLGDRLQVLAFASHTRNRIRVFTVKDWNEAWSVGRDRLEGLQPQGYTRIGPAIRHATAELTKITARQKVLLLIGDGKPTDFDRYEGSYGVADVRRALGEARDQRIVAHALAVDTVARQTLPTMFGTGRWNVLRHPGELPEALSLAYGELT